MSFFIPHASSSCTPLGCWGVRPLHSLPTYFCIPLFKLCWCCSGLGSFLSPKLLGQLSLAVFSAPIVLALFSKYIFLISIQCHFNGLLETKMIRPLNLRSSRETPVWTTCLPTLGSLPQVLQNPWEGLWKSSAGLTLVVSNSAALGWALRTVFLMSS